MTLQIHEMSFSYKTKAVFRGIDLQVDKGEILSLVGPNGAGKTTLLKCVNRLHEPTGGKALIDGRNIQSMKRSELAKAVAYIPQAAPTSFPITVFDTVLLGRRPYLNWKPSQGDVDMVLDVLQRLELSDLAMRDLNELSGGERQKVILAKAIVQNPQIMLFDEPTTYLDLKFQLKIMQFIRDLVDERQICAVVTTHDLNLALQFSDKVAVLKDGAIMTSGSPDVLTEDVILHTYEVIARVHQEEGVPHVVPIKAVN